MSKLHTNPKNATRRCALAASALAICFTVAGVVAPAQAGCNYRLPATVNWGGNQAASPYGANNNGLVSVQPAANVNWSASSYTFYGRYSGNGNTDDREPLSGGNFYGRGRGMQSGGRIEEVNTIGAVWRDSKTAEQTQVRPPAARATNHRSIAQYNLNQTLRDNRFSGGFDQIRIRGIGGNQGAQNGRSLVQINGQTNLTNQIQRVEVVGHRPTPLNRIPLLNSRFDRQAASNRDMRRDLLINVTVRPVNQR